MAEDALAVWNALDEAEQRRIFATLSQLAAQRAEADRDTYASNFTDAPRVEIYQSAAARGRLTIRYLFHWWEWCPAQSGSDWNYHCVYCGTATFAGNALDANDIEVVRRDYVHENDEKSYDREAVLSQARSALAARTSVAPAPAARAGEPSPEAPSRLNLAIPLHKAVLEGRVLLVREVASWFASGGVDFARATADDVNSAGQLDSEYFVSGEPLTDEDVRSYAEGPWDRPSEFFEKRERWALEAPFSSMRDGARQQLKQAVASLVAGLLERLPAAVAGRAAAHVELLRAYARQASPELAERLVASARAVGLEQTLFDADLRWEKGGSVDAIVRDFAQAFPIALLSLSGSTSGANAVVAADALRDWLLQALGNAAIEAGADHVPVIELDGVPLPADSPSPAQGWPLVDLIGDLDRLQTACVRRICIGALLGRLTTLRGCSDPVAELLETADAHALEPTPELVARAESLARRAAEMGGSPAFGVPLQLLSLGDAAAIVNLTLDAERALAGASFRELASGSLADSAVEPRLGDPAASALESELRLLFGRFGVRDSARPSRDLLSSGWRLDAEHCRLEAGVLHAFVATPFGLEDRSIANTEEQLEDFELCVDFKLSGAECLFWFRLAPSALEPYTGYRTSLGTRAWGGIHDADGRRGPHVGAVPLPRLQVRQEGWNTCFIRAEGPRISVAINGVKTSECVDEGGSRRGQVGIQIYSPNGQLGRVWFKNMRLSELPSRGSHGWNALPSR